MSATIQFRDTLSSLILFRNSKLRKYKTIILPVVLYGQETRSLTVREKKKKCLSYLRYTRKIEIGVNIKLVEWVGHILHVLRDLGLNEFCLYCINQISRPLLQKMSSLFPASSHKHSLFFLQLSLFIEYLTDKSQKDLNTSLCMINMPSYAINPL